MVGRFVPLLFIKGAFIVAISIEELIENKEANTKKNKQQYDLQTSIGIITIQVPTRSFIAETIGVEDSDAYLIINSVVAPNLSDKKLLKAYGCLEPLDIVDRLFDSGEVSAISKKIVELAGFGKEIQAELHLDIKN